MSARRIAVLAGGLSLERELSLRSGRRLAGALTSLGHDVTTLDLDHELVDRLDALRPEVVVLALHGKAGEDGTIQGLLELLGIPYTGSDAMASALAWDKAIFKGLVRRQGLATPAWASISVDAVRDMGAAGAFDRVADELGLPLFVKPTQGGASMGVRRVEERNGLSAALVGSFSYHHTALVEKAVQGTEVAVALLDGEPLPAVEIQPVGGAAYDFSARYTAGATTFYAPARLPAEVLESCAQIALAAYALTGCRHLTRADLVVDDEGRPWLLELDTCPGMTETSLYPVAIDAAGMSFPDFAQRVLDLVTSGDTPTPTETFDGKAQAPSAAQP